MAKKKKKMTKAQAAAARRDDKPRRAVSTVAVKDDGPKSKDTRLFQVLIPVISIAVIVILSFVFTIGPGMFMQG
jgi:hypothetical protein